MDVDLEVVLDIGMSLERSRSLREEVSESESSLWVRRGAGAGGWMVIGIVSLVVDCNRAAYKLEWGKLWISGCLDSRELCLAHGMDEWLAGWFQGCGAVG